MSEKNDIKDFDVAISTRVRIARNLNDTKFPNMLDNKEMLEVSKQIEKAVDKNKYDYFYTKNIDDSTLLSLVEKHLISKEFIEKKDSAILQNKDSSIVCMINEEDHIRAQSFSLGFEPMKCYEKIKNFENDISGKLNFAKNKKYGYLTSCPTNLGSGMRVSVLVHLVGLALLGRLEATLNQVRDIGLSVRGFYGENTAGYGYMYQISNQKTLGITDEDIINRVSIVISSLIEQERNARKILLSRGIELEDKIFRAYGILKNCRKITEEETFRLLSYLRVGVSTKIIKNVDLYKVQKIFDNMQENSLKLVYKEDFDKKEDLIKRANYIREELC